MMDWVDQVCTNYLKFTLPNELLDVGTGYDSVQFRRSLLDTVLDLGLY